MLNKMRAFLRQQDLIQPEETVICAVSGGADSVALLFALYLMKDKWRFHLEAAHFNHHLRGEESDRDEAFVRQLCDRYDIPLHLGQAQVTAGKKGLEAAARDARYAFFATLPGKIATAHTADDNAETVLMHLIRGTGLKGLGGIAPIRGQIIRPMLTVTRQEVENFLDEWCLSHIEDSSNETDAFLRNRIRHHVMPLLTQENPRIAENLSQMAMRLRLDEECLAVESQAETLPTVESLKKMPKARRIRCLEAFLKENGVKEPEEAHLAMAETLVFSENPSAKANFPGGVVVTRCYDRLEVLTPCESLEAAVLPCPGQTQWGDWCIRCTPAETIVNTADTFTVCPEGQLIIRSRQSGDTIRLPGGTKSLKKLFIDRKIPAAQRERLPVLCDDRGLLGVYPIGIHLDRAAETLPGVTIQFIKKNKGE